jgi:hypothetical protein
MLSAARTGKSILPFAWLHRPQSRYLAIRCRGHTYLGQTAKLKLNPQPGQIMVLPTGNDMRQITYWFELASHSYCGAYYNIARLLENMRIFFYHQCRISAKTVRLFFGFDCPANGHFPDPAVSTTDNKCCNVNNRPGIASENQ